MDHWIFTGIAIGIFCAGLAFAKWSFETLARIQSKIERNAGVEELIK